MHSTVLEILIKHGVEHLVLKADGMDTVIDLGHLESAFISKTVGMTDITVIKTYSELFIIFDKISSECLNKGHKYVGHNLSLGGTSCLYDPNDINHTLQQTDTYNGVNYQYVTAPPLLNICISIDDGIQLGNTLDLSHHLVTAANWTGLLYDPCLNTQTITNNRLLNNDKTKTSLSFFVTPAFNNSTPFAAGWLYAHEMEIGNHTVTHGNEDQQMNKYDKYYWKKQYNDNNLMLQLWSHIPTKSIKALRKPNLGATSAENAGSYWQAVFEIAKDNSGQIFYETSLTYNPYGSQGIKNAFKFYDKPMKVSVFMDNNDEYKGYFGNLLNQIQTDGYDITPPDNLYIYMMPAIGFLDGLNSTPTGMRLPKITNSQKQQVFDAETFKRILTDASNQKATNLFLSLHPQEFDISFVQILNTMRDGGHINVKSIENAISRELPKFECKDCSMNKPLKDRFIKIKLDDLIAGMPLSQLQSEDKILKVPSTIGSGWPICSAGNGDCQVNASDVSACLNGIIKGDLSGIQKCRNHDYSPGNQYIFDYTHILSTIKSDHLVSMTDYKEADGSSNLGYGNTLNNMFKVDITAKPKNKVCQNRKDKSIYFCPTPFKENPCGIKASLIEPPTPNYWCNYNYLTTSPPAPTPPSSCTDCAAPSKGDCKSATTGVCYYSSGGICPGGTGFCPTPAPGPAPSPPAPSPPAPSPPAPSPPAPSSNKYCGDTMDDACLVKGTSCTDDFDCHAVDFCFPCPTPSQGGEIPGQQIILT